MFLGAAIEKQLVPESVGKSKKWVWAPIRTQKIPSKDEMKNSCG